jgi:hypothetical protein
LLSGNPDAGVATVKTVEIVDVAEVANPFADAEEVEVGGADEIDRSLVAMEKAANVGDITKFVHASCLPASNRIVVITE